MQRVLGRVVTRSRFVYSSYVILIGWFCIYRKTCSIFGELTCLAFLRRTEYGDLSSENSDMGTWKGLTLAFVFAPSSNTKLRPMLKVSFVDIYK